MVDVISSLCIQDSSSIIYSWIPPQFLSTLPHSYQHTNMLWFLLFGKIISEVTKLLLTPTSLNSHAFSLLSFITEFLHCLYEFFFSLSASISMLVNPMTVFNLTLLDLALIQGDLIQLITLITLFLLRYTCYPWVTNLSPIPRFPLTLLVISFQSVCLLFLISPSLDVGVCLDPVLDFCFS